MLCEHGNRCLSLETLPGQINCCLTPLLVHSSQWDLHDGEIK